MGGCLVNVVNKTWFDPSGRWGRHARDTGLGMRWVCVWGGGGVGLIKRVYRKSTERNNESEVSSLSLVLLKKGKLKIRKKESPTLLPDIEHILTILILRLFV